MLLLGPIVFQDFEIPESLAFGGTQSLTIHRLPGGARVIDAMGRDDAEMHWSGTFSGPFAAERARAIDLLRVEGQRLALIWDAFFYTVVIACFEAEYTRPTWIPYRLSCTVLVDEAAQFETLAISLAALAVTDAVSAISYNPTTDGLQITLAAPGTATAGTAANSVANSALRNGRATLTTRIATDESSLVSPTNASSLATVTDIAGELASKVTARAYLNRAASNLSRAST